MAYLTVDAALKKEAEWDKLIAVLPRCAICDGIIFPDSVVYVAHEKCVCRSCKELLDDRNEIYMEETR